MAALKSLEDRIPEAIQNQDIEVVTGRKHSDKSTMSNLTRR